LSGADFVIVRRGHQRNLATSLHPTNLATPLHPLAHDCATRIKIIQRRQE